MKKIVFTLLLVFLTFANEQIANTQEKAEKNINLKYFPYSSSINEIPFMYNGFFQDSNVRVTCPEYTTTLGCNIDFMPRIICGEGRSKINDPKLAQNLRKFNVPISFDLQKFNFSGNYQRIQLSEITNNIKYDIFYQPQDGEHIRLIITDTNTGTIIYNSLLKLTFVLDCS